MNEQWQELKETIIELRDNDGTATQQEVCKFLANLMDVLEKQMSSSENLNRWIPVSERLPEENGSYFVTVKRGYVTTAIWVGAAEFWNEVTAWMPLPEPYKTSPAGAERSDKE